MSQWPSNGYRLFKGKGSRLVREIYDNGDVDDWTNGQIREGLTGWKKGLIFTRHCVYSDPGGKMQVLYRIQCDRKRTLDTVAQGFAEKYEDAWAALFDALKAKGVMPKDQKE